MTYSLRFEERPEYLFAEVCAESVTVDMVRRYLTEIHDKCIQTGHTHLLLRRDIPGVFPMGTFFEVSAGTVPILRGIRAASLRRSRRVAPLRTPPC